VDLIFGAVVSLILAAAFQRWIYASGGRQLPCVTVLCCVIFIILVCCVVEGNLMGEQGAIFASEKRAGIIKVLH